jgi:hypothetical protein
MTKVTSYLSTYQARYQTRFTVLYFTNRYYAFIYIRFKGYLATQEPA